MKNKLLLTTALISGLSVIGSASFAETKITGEIKTGYKTGESIAATEGGRAGFFRESQLNVVKSGDLNNGLKYSAGFSFESDGGDAAGATGAKNVVTSDEGFFIQIDSGNTGILIGLDKAPNIDQSPTPRVAENAATAATGYAGASYSQSGGTVNQAFGIALIQKTPIGQFSANFVPDMGNQGTSDTAILAETAKGNQGYELVYRGKPIAAAPGLDVMVAQSVQTNKNSIVAGGSDDQKVTVMAAGYNFGKFAVGYDRRNKDSWNATDSTTDKAGIDQTSTEISASAVVSNNVSVGIGMIEIDFSDKTLDEEIKYLQVGYNMGAIFSSVGVFDVENGAGTATNEGKMYTARLGVKF